MIDFPTTMRPTELDRENVAIISEVEPEHRSGAAIISRALDFYVNNALPKKSVSVARRTWRDIINKRRAELAKLQQTSEATNA